MLRQNPDADLPGCHADDEGENDRSLITSDTKTRPLKPGTDCQIEFRLIHTIADATTLTEAGYVGEDVENIILKLLQSADYGYVSARNNRSAGFRCEPSGWASAAERSPRYKPRPTMLAQRASHPEAWFCSIYHGHRCSGPHWPTNSKRAQLHKLRRSVIACLGT